MGKIVAYKDGNKISIISAVDHKSKNMILRTAESPIIKLNNGIILAFNSALIDLYCLKDMFGSIKFNDDIDFGYAYIANHLVKPIHDALYGIVDGSGSGSIKELDFCIIIAYRDQMFILDYDYNIMPIFDSIAFVGSRTSSIELFENHNMLVKLPLKDRVIKYIYLSDGDLVDNKYILRYINTKDLKEEVIKYDAN